MKNSLGLFIALFLLCVYAPATVVAPSSYTGKGSGGGGGEGVDCTGVSAGYSFIANGDGTCSWAPGSGSGDVLGAASSVDGEIVLYSSTTGKVIKRATGTGLVSVSSGVFQTPGKASATNGGTNLDTSSSTGIPHIASGTWSVSALTGSDLPNPGASSLGGVQSKASVSHNYLTQISTSGVVSQAQPVLADLSDVTLGATALNNLALGSFTGHYEGPTAKTYFIDFKAAFPYTINTLDIATVSGTCSAAVKIGSTTVTGISAVSVSSTPATGTASANNVVSAGNQVTLIISSVSSPVDLAYTLKYTRN